MHKVKEIFNEIVKIPRNSGKEDLIRKWLIKYAEDKNWEIETDEVGNLVIRIWNKDPSNNPIILQAHMDMVCQKEEGTDFDFSKDEIQSYIENGWLHAQKTTLGADNGIGMSMMLALADENYENKPNLELLFTVDEEQGLTGAKGISSDLLNSNYLINLDSEDEGVFTIGCAGGVRCKISNKFELIELPDTFQAIELKVEGGLGGHSGVEIHKGRANAIKVLARFLKKFNKSNVILISEINAGKVTNAIPNSAKVVIGVKDSSLNALKSNIKEFNEEISSELSSTDKDICISLKKVVTKEKFILDKDSSVLLNFLMVLPDGVFTMSNDIDDLVETSSNLGVLALQNGSLEAQILARGSVKSRLDNLIDQIIALTELVNYNFRVLSRYPGWEPNPKSNLVLTASKIYKEMFEKKPVVEAIHAGLECGVIGAKYPNMQMFSIGPTIKNPHTPDEKVELDSIDKVYEFLKKLISILD